MERAALAMALTLAVAGCTVPAPRVEDVPDGDMPVMLAYGSLARGTTEIKQMTDPRSGANVKRLMVEGEGEWAIVEAYSVGGDYIFTALDPRSATETMLRPGIEIAWGERGVVRGTRSVAWRRLTLPEPAASCLAMVRTTREHVEGGIDNAVQAYAAALYCREGTNAIPGAEIPAIAAALQVRR